MCSDNCYICLQQTVGTITHQLLYCTTNALFNLSTFHSELWFLCIQQPPGLRQICCYHFYCEISWYSSWVRNLQVITGSRNYILQLIETLLCVIQHLLWNRVYISWLLDTLTHTHTRTRLIPTYMYRKEYVRIQTRECTSLNSSSSGVNIPLHLLVNDWRMHANWLVHQL
jgi:hypothetical protein